ncbi:MAG: TetR/AcrR family transcriptional regulator [Calothrix sp. SM1_5_4]|nr:TetR/AcrR family transcriptional regulator [Calothrix sp. SM1_5_4]
MSRLKLISDYDVLERAFEIISKEGFDSFTFAQVGKAVGLSPAALVKRFKTKKNLAFLARNQRWERNLSVLDQDEIRGLRGLNGIFDFLTLIALSVNSKRLGEHARWLGTEAGHPRSKKKVAAYFETTRDIFSRLVAQAVHDKDLAGIGQSQGVRTNP